MTIEIDRRFNWIEVKYGVKVIARFELETLDDVEINKCANELGDLISFLGHHFEIKEIK